MYCVIKNDMKFGEYFIPAKTRARVINKPNYKDANVPGLDLYLAITLRDIVLMQKKSALLSEVEIENELAEKNKNTVMVGITISTDGTKVFMDAGADFYEDATISEYQVKKVLGVDDIPKEIKKVQYMVHKYYLNSVIDYLEDQFSKWVQKKCEFYTYTEEDIENGNCVADAEAGDTTLSTNGLEQFENKKLEYQEKLERIGFTYEFTGGLIWE